MTERVYPKLREYSRQKYGLEFQVSFDRKAVDFTVWLLLHFYQYAYAFSLRLYVNGTRRHFINEHYKIVLIFTVPV